MKYSTCIVYNNSSKHNL